MASYRADFAGQIKRLLTTKEVAERYGFSPNRSGFIQCPFHAGDDHGSLKIYPGSGGWHCFGCGSGGSVIDFAMRLFDISFQQAILRLNSDFGLGLTKDAAPMVNQSALLAARQREEDRKRKADSAYKKQAARYRYYTDVIRQLAPKDCSSEIVPLFAEALLALPALEYWLDEHLGE